MNKKLVTVALSAVVVVAACAGMVTLVHSGNLNQPEVETSSITETVKETVQQAQSDIQQMTETVDKIVDTVSTTAATTAVPWYKRFIPSNSTTYAAPETTAGTEPSTEAVTEPSTAATTEAPKTTAPKTTAPKTTAPKTTAAPKTTKAITSSGTLPGDMSFTGLRKAGYEVFGNKPYIYNNDKDCAQSEFGYNRFYDKAAGLLDFHIDTCRLQFNNYDGRDWMIQLWKGTYITGDIGTVGCEIGLYNRKAGRSGGALDHYACAEEPDWLNMEMTLLWDENYDNNFKAQFTRRYGPYWWPTGFVDGQLRNVKDTSCLRVLGRITFRDTVMADKFVNALNNVGFTEVSNFTLRKDTFKRYICDVIFCWQDARD